MITRRILKKKSKQALPILRKHYPDVLGDVFLAKTGENYHGLVIRCTHGAGDPAYGNRPYCRCCAHPLAGTPMTGEVSGHYEPEWDERPLLATLRDVVRWQDRPATMSNREWRRTLSIAGCAPFDAEAFEAEMAAAEAEYLAQAEEAA